jgi:beta-glucuronidase
MANETKISDERNTFLKKLIDFTREKDDTRLISVALLSNKERSTETVKVIDDPFGKNVDIISANQYSGWYGGLPDIIKNIKWQIEYDKPFVFSEFGAGALQGFHADSLTVWSEEYQEWYYKETLKMCNSVEKLRGISPWILIDFQSPKRQVKPYQNGFNRKGIISNEGVKKKAFYVLQDYYKNK